MNKNMAMSILGCVFVSILVHGSAYGQPRVDFSPEAIARDTAMVKRSCTNSKQDIHRSVDCDCVERRYRERRATEVPPLNTALPHHGSRFFSDCFAPEKMVQVAREKCPPILTNKYALYTPRSLDRSKDQALLDRLINAVSVQCDCYANEMGKARTLADVTALRQPAAAAAACGIPAVYYQHNPIWTPVVTDLQLKQYVDR